MRRHEGRERRANAAWLFSRVECAGTLGEGVIVMRIMQSYGYERERVRGDLHDGRAHLGRLSSSICIRAQNGLGALHDSRAHSGRVLSGIDIEAADVERGRRIYASFQGQSNRG